MNSNRLFILALAFCGLSLPASAQTVILDPLSVSGDFDETGSDGFNSGDTFSSGWLVTRRNARGFGSNNATRLAGASDSYARTDARRTFLYDLGYTTAGTGETYNMSYYTILNSIGKPGDFTDESALLTMYYTGDNTLQGGVVDGIALELTPTNSTADTAWDFASIAGASFGTDPGAGKNLFLSYTVGQSATNEVNIGIDNISVAVVPEPGSFALLAGMFGLTWVMLRRRS